MNFSSCPCCASPTILDVVQFLASDAGLDGSSREFVLNMQAIVLRGLDLAAPHQSRLAELYAARRGALAAAVGARRAAFAIGETR